MLMVKRIAGIKAYTVKKKNGLTYRFVYHRATGERIMAQEGTAAFMAEIEALDKKVAGNQPKDGTLSGLTVAYKKSPEWEALKPRTRKDYDRVFDYLRPMGEMPLVQIDGPFMYGLRDKAFKKHKRRFANYVIQVVRLLLKWGKARGHVEVNAAAGVEKIRRPKGMGKANRAWHDNEREIVLAEASIEMRAMIALGMFAALREGDACAVKRNGYDGKLIEAVASKNDEHLWIPAHFRLCEILKEAAKARAEKMHRRAQRRKVLPMDPPTLCVTSHGTAWTESGLRASFFKLVRRLEQEGKVKPGLTFHGLRHTVGRLIVEAGGTARDVQIILGDRSEAMGKLYSEEHERKKLATATVRRLERNERRRLSNSADKSV